MIPVDLRLLPGNLFKIYYSHNHLGPSSAVPNVYVPDLLYRAFSDSHPTREQAMADAPPIVNGRVYRHLKDKSSFDWVVNHHRANLVRSVSNQTPLEFWNREFFSQDQEAGLRGRRGFRIDFAELQRMKLRKLQIKLVRHTVEMAKTGKEPGKPAEEEVVSKPNGNGKTDDTKFEVKNGKGKEKAADARNDNDAKVEIKHEKEEERTADAGDGDGATGWERDLENYGMYQAAPCPKRRKKLMTLPPPRYDM